MSLWVRRYGTWPSTISAAAVAQVSPSYGDIAIGSDGAVWWTETRPGDGGRTVIVRRCRGERRTDVIGPGWDARNRVHEYGGAAWSLFDAGYVFTEFSDGRVYLAVPVGGEPVALTPASTPEREDRYGDLAVLPDLSGLIAVRERHRRGGVVRELVLVSLHGTLQEPQVLFAGSDFVSSPRVSPDGSEIAFITWNRPAMPWDSSELRRMPIHDPEAVTVVAGGDHESLQQPQWAPDGSLYVLSDRKGWWNLCRCDRAGLLPMREHEEEYADPPWVLGMRTYCLLSTTEAVVRYGTSTHCLSILDLKAGELTKLDIRYPLLVSTIDARRSEIAVIGEAPNGTHHVLIHDRQSGVQETIALSDLGHPAVDLRGSHLVRVRRKDAGSIPVQLYPPSSSTCTGPPSDRPPWIVFVHGGPTWRRASAPLEVAYFTSRGFGVADVDYSGSCGWGREWRRSLYGHWGVLDVDDCLEVGRWLAASGTADPCRLAIRGGSAGGWTALCAVTRSTVFSAAVSLCGVVDATRLAADTHDFEAHYLDSLIGPLPDAQQLYDDRSPLSNAHRIQSPVLILQGLDDPVVPPTQAQALVSVLDEHSVPYAYVAFEGERHGLRRAESRAAALDAEFAFYDQVFGLDTPGAVGLEIRNLVR